MQPRPSPDRWFIRQQGSDVQGPFRLGSVRAWIESGRLRREMEVSPDRQRWVPAEPGFEEAFDLDAPPPSGRPATKPDSRYPLAW